MSAKAHRIAVEVSAYVCTQNGAMPKYPAELVAKVKWKDKGCRDFEVNPES